jgi:hypothetical protein
MYNELIMLLQSITTNDCCPITLDAFNDEDNQDRQTFVHLGIRFFAQDLAHFIVCNVNFKNPVRQIEMKRRDVVLLHQVINYNLLTVPHNSIVYFYDNRQLLLMKHKENLNLIQFVENECSNIIHSFTTFSDAHIDIFIHQLNSHRFAFYQTFVDLYNTDPMRGKACLSAMKDIALLPSIIYRTEEHRHNIMNFIDVFINAFYGAPGDQT